MLANFEASTCATLMSKFQYGDTKCIQSQTLNGLGNMICVEGICVLACMLPSVGKTILHSGRVLVLVAPVSLIARAAKALSKAAAPEVQGAAERDGVSIALSYLHSPRRSASEAAHKFLASCLQHAHEVTICCTPVALWDMDSMQHTSLW